MCPSATRLPTALFTARSVRALDRFTIEQCGIPGRTLMQRAGEAVWRTLRRRWPRAARIGVLAGLGNNAGDGYVVALAACRAGLDVTVWQMGEAARLTGDAAFWAGAARDAGVPVQPAAGFDPRRSDVIVDALFGTGLARPVEGAWAALIEAVDASGRPVVAVDTPSGIAADTGAVLGVAVRARATVTFVGLKQGLFTGRAPAYVGSIEFDDLGVPDEARSAVAPDARLVDLAALQGRWLAPRPRDTHKGHFGHLLVVGGNVGYAGAARMAAEAALRSGAGLVSVATHPAHAATLGIGRPELMVHPVADAAALSTLLARATAVVAGPGLGRDDWAQGLLAALLERPGPMVLDADALNLLAADPLARDDWVLTPHPGEAGRLLGSDAAAVQADRFAALAALAGRYGGTVVLKGAGTLVGSAGAPPAVCPLGNPGMASGGMGDVLAGVVGGLLAQRLPPPAAAELGVAVHGAAADAAAADGERGLVASDLLAPMRRLLNP